MTKFEIAHFLGYKQITDINKAFVKASEECPSIKAKMGKQTKTRPIDYTEEEVVTAMKYFRHHTYTPMVECLLLENFIHRDKPYAQKEKIIKPPRDAQNMLYFLHILKRFYLCCDTCIYMEARTPRRVGAKPRPYCTFYKVFLHKIKPTPNIYKDRCNSAVFKKGPYPIFTEEGMFSSNQVDLFENKIVIKKNTSFLGIDQKNFFSKRKANEPIIILRDAFDEELKLPEQKLRIPKE